MVNIKFAKDWAEIFKHFGLKTFQDFFEYSAGTHVNRNEKRDVIVFSLPLETGAKEFFMKRFYRPHAKDVFFTLTNFGHICLQAECEWNNADILIQNGIDTYKPVCCGGKTICGIERKSFFVTEKLTGRPLTDFVAQNWSELPQRQKEKIFTTLGNLIRKVHNAKISLPDLYIWHIFISRTDNGEYDFSIIDLHRMRINTTGKNERIKNLAAFNFSMLDKYFGRQIRNVFLNAYLGNDYTGDKEALWRKIKKRSDQLTARRKKPDY